VTGLVADRSKRNLNHPRARAFTLAANGLSPPARTLAGSSCDSASQHAAARTSGPAGHCQYNPVERRLRHALRVANPNASGSRREQAQRAPAWDAAHGA